MVMRGLARRLTERSVERPVVEGKDGEKVDEKTGDGRRWTAMDGGKGGGRVSRTARPRDWHHYHRRP
jgi:hypothetical protein